MLTGTRNYVFNLGTTGWLLLGPPFSFPLQENFGRLILSHERRRRRREGKKKRFLWRKKEAEKDYPSKQKRFSEFELKRERERKRRLVYLCGMRISLSMCTVHA